MFKIRLLNMFYFNFKREDVKISISNPLRDKKIALVTGAGSGIGREFVKLCWANDMIVIAASLLEEELINLAAEAKGHIHILPMDLSKAGAADDLLKACDDLDLPVDVVINNAGFACFNDVVDEDWKKMSGMIDLNIKTVTALSALFGKRMKARGTGYILNVGSTAGLMPSKRMAAYCASKAYVNCFTYALAAELAPFGVTVTCLLPGATNTNFASAGGFEQFEGKSMLKALFAKGNAGSASDVAQEGMKGLLAGKRRVLTGKGAKISAILSKLVPQHKLPNLFRQP